MARGLRGSIVDLGCGEGGTLAALQTAFPDVAGPLGIELSETRARIARGRGLAVVLADAMRLPVKRASVSLAISRHVIEHVADDEEAIKQITDALEPGGVLYLETPLRLPWAWYPYRNAAGSWMLDPTHVREYRDTLEVSSLLTRAGLECRELESSPIRFPLGQLVLRIPGTTSALGRFAPRVRDTAKPAVRIPRYHEMRCLAVKP